MGEFGHVAQSHHLAQLADVSFHRSAGVPVASGKGEGDLESLATASALAARHLGDEHHRLAPDGHALDAPGAFAASPHLLTVALRAHQHLIFDLQMNLHASLHMLGASILLPFAHSLGTMQQILAHHPTFAKQSLYASTSVMNPVFTSSGEAVF